jgi:hypothetical protein
MQTDEAVEATKTKPLHLAVGASTALCLGITLTLAALVHTEGVISFQIGGVVTPFAAWILMMLATRPRWPALLGSLAIAVLYAFLGYASAANFIFLGLIYLPLILAISVGRKRLLPARSLALRILGLTALGLFAGISMGFFPYPSGWLLALAPWISSKAPKATLIMNKCLSVALALTLLAVGAFSSAATTAFSSAATTGGTIGLVAMIAGASLLRGSADKADDAETQ